MAQTLVALLVHVVFSTKNRANLIAPEVETELYSYVGGILKGRGSRLIAAGGTSNHVHLLISLSKNDALPAMMQELKKSTSKWIKTRDTSSAGFSGRRCTEHSPSVRHRFRSCVCTLLGRSCTIRKEVLRTNSSRSSIGMVSTTIQITSGDRIRPFQGRIGLALSRWRCPRLCTPGSV